MLRLFTSHIKSSVRNDDYAMSLLQCLTEIAPYDAKLVVSVRLGGAVVLSAIASMLKSKPVSSTNKMLLVAIRALHMLCKSPPNAVFMHAKGHVSQILPLVSVEPRNYELSICSASLLLVLMSLPDACKVLLAKGGFRAVLDLLVSWSQADSKYGDVGRLIISMVLLEG